MKLAYSMLNLCCSRYKIPLNYDRVGEERATSEHTGYSTALTVCGTIPGYLLKGKQQENLQAPAATTTTEQLLLRHHTMRINLAPALLTLVALVITGTAGASADVDPTEPRELRTASCPSSNLPGVEACSSVVNAPAGDPCASCEGNRDCPEGYHCSGPRSDLKCVSNELCVEEGCACNRKRDCCGQPNPPEGEDDLRCRKPPFGHPLYTPENNRMFCLPLDTWKDGE